MHQVAKPESEYGWGDAEALDDFYAKELDERGIDEAWYWYVAGSYEGSGQIIFRRGGKWGQHDMGHCSCYGPTCHLDTGDLKDSLDDLESSMSSDLRKECATVIAAARG